MIFLDMFHTEYYRLDFRAKEVLLDVADLIVDLWKAFSVNWSRRWNRSRDAGRKRPRNGGTSVWTIIERNPASEYIPGQETRHAATEWRRKPGVWPLLERVSEELKWQREMNVQINRLIGEIRWMFDNPPEVVPVHECGDCVCHLDAYRAQWEAEHTYLRALTA